MDACLGVDWGTYSSKWCYQDSIGRIVVGGMWDSRVWRVGDSLAMFSQSRRYLGEKGVAALKRKLIHDPGQAFWEGERSDIKASLGEAVVFSLATLLLDAAGKLKSAGVDFAKAERIRVRFSHPNWISPEAVAALQCYRDAAVIALSVLKAGLADADVANDSLAVPLTAIKQLISARQSHAASLDRFPREYEYKAYSKCAMGVDDGVEWNFVFESAAAGFPYLAEMEPGLFEGDITPSDAKFRKILVIDIGAGSTDAGYMLRTIRLDSRTLKPNEPILIWMPAAAALDMAGTWLTDQIYADWHQQGRKATRTEAEDYKTSGVTDWYSKPYVKKWCDDVASHVAHYIAGVQDNMRLPHKPFLELVVTGGSSAVTPVKACLLDHVKEALLARGIGSGVVDGTTVTQPYVAALKQGGYSETQMAQLAVSLGASHPRMVDLTHYDRL
ncbi:MAG TPA: hypothetical protein VGS27_06685 [Candidatus Sulfotelmatobacter sp.]|nr:hypothetical protein [Candidatus Sulfotelmatobacter sp.]